MADVCIVLLLPVFNFVLMRSPIPVTGKVRAAAIQYGIVPEEKNSDPKLERIRKMYIAEDEKGQSEAAMRDLLVPLTKKAAAMGAQLIVWPEDAIQIDPDRDAALAARIAALAKESNAMIVAPFIAPLPGKENEKNPEGVNGAVFYNSEGKRVFRYLKQHRIRTLDMELGPKGNTTKLLDAGTLGQIGYMICYDSDYPDIATKYAGHGAEYFVNSSHDLARFITIHHPYLLMFRGIEHRRSMVKSDIVNGALITDFRGRILSDPPDGTQIAIADVPLTSVRTPYPVFSKYLGLGAVILFPLLLVFSAMQLRKK
jgi:apolipoprotein N-acyltransferase